MPPVAAGMRRLSIIDLSGGSQPVLERNPRRLRFAQRRNLQFHHAPQRTQGAGPPFPRAFQYRDEIDSRLRSLGRALGRAVARRVRLRHNIEIPGGRGGRAARVFSRATGSRIEPLYLRAWRRAALFFASEVCTLLASGCIPARVSTQALSTCLSCSAPSDRPLTVIEAVSSLPPGHTLSIDAGMPVAEPARSPTGIRRWPPKCCHRESRLGRPIAEARSAGTRAFGRCRREPSRRRRAHRRVLSSGLDSTAIAALASRSQRGIHTFTVAFPDVEFSEAEKTRRTAKRLGTEHSELTLSGDEMVAQLAKPLPHSINRARTA